MNGTALSYLLVSQDWEQLEIDHTSLLKKSSASSSILNSYRNQKWKIPLNASKCLESAKIFIGLSYHLLIVN